MDNSKHIVTTESRPAPFSEWFQREPLLARFTLGVLALIPLICLGLIFDERTLHGVNVWIKPLKFNIAITVYLGTLVWFSGWLDRSVMHRLYYRVYVFILCSSMVLLLAWLYSATVMGEAAHYNRTHPILAPVYSLMGVVSVVFTSGTLVVAILIAINKRSPLTDCFRYAVVSSLAISFLFTVVIAGELASMDSHWIGGMQSDAHGLPLLGWSRDGGDLRVAHFFSLHAMQIMPLAALVAPKKSSASHPKLFASLLSVLYISLILFVYFQAKQALPFMPWLG